MLASISNLRVYICTLLFCLLTSTVFCDTITYDWTIGWSWLNPDGQFWRSVITINNQWPPPELRATKGDNVVINVHNELGNQSTSIHFHGLFMNGSAHMDGTSSVSQCAIPTGSSFTYEFAITQSGTYWYHSHMKSQYPDGLRGMFIIGDSDSPYIGQYENEIVVTLSDWYHDESPSLVAKYGIDSGHMGPHDPVPDANLINDMAASSTIVQPGGSYLIRVANIGAFTGQYFWIQGHSFRIVEVDGIFTEPKVASLLYVGCGQRYTVLVTMSDVLTASVPIIARLDTSLFGMKDKLPELNAIHWLTIEDKKEEEPIQDIDLTTAFNDLALLPSDNQTLLPEPDRRLNLTLDFLTDPNGVMHWTFDQVEYETPDMPSLFQTLRFLMNSSDVNIYSKSSHPIVLRADEVVEIFIHNKHMRKHPLHLHGHNFQVLYRSEGQNDQLPKPEVPVVPLKRDTIVVNSHGNATIRFRADNPGAWLFHCHMEWHAHSGLVATFIEAPDKLRSQMFGKAFQLSLGNDGKCPGPLTPAYSDDSNAVQEDKERLENAIESLANRASLVRIVSTIAIFSILAAAIGFFGIKWYRTTSISKSKQEYSAVPIVEAEEFELAEDDEKPTE